MRKHRYDVGDKVVVRPDLDMDSDFFTHYTNQSVGISEHMLKYAGKVVTIVRTVEECGVGESAKKKKKMTLIELPKMVEDGIG